jgi:putative NADH-flavin reductase
MELTIVAAAGGVGRRPLEQAVTDGHEVTAVSGIRPSPTGRCGR